MIGKAIQYEVFMIGKAIQVKNVLQGSK